MKHAPIVATLIALGPMAEAQGVPDAYDRIVGATACVGGETPTRPLRSAPNRNAPRIGIVTSGTCYPTGGCRNGWCALESPTGMGYLPDVDIMVIQPISGTPFNHPSR